MQIIVDDASCTGCGVCVKVCPQQILSVPQGAMRVDDIDRCMGCFGCEDECRSGAVRVLRAPQSTQQIQIEAPPEGITQCDVAIVGAGPAGLGAAITCAKAGLDTVVFERLPNRKLSHHPDGGVFFSLPWMTSVNCTEDELRFPELDISIKAKVARKCKGLGLLGPDGLSTKNKVPDDIEAWAGHKDKFNEGLIDEAERLGAKFWFNAKVVDVLKDREKITGIKLSSGEKIQAKVVVTADGVMAKTSEKAGFPIDKKDLWYASLLAFEYDNVDNLPSGLFYLNGDIEYGEDPPVMLGGVAITDVVHVLIGVFSKKRTYPAEKPIDFYVKELIASDSRVHDILGDRFKDVPPQMLTGCRGVFRGQSNRSVVLDGAISIGDAWVNGGELGNVPALANGVHAGKVIIKAAEKEDFSADALSPAADFVSDKLVGLVNKNKEMKLIETRVSKEDFKTFFAFMQHINYPIMLLGTPSQQGLMFAGFMFKNLFRMIRHPRLAKLLF